MPVPIYPGVILSSLGFAGGLSLLSSFYVKFVNIVLHFLPRPVREILSGVSGPGSNHHPQQTRIVNMNINSQLYELHKFAESNECEEIVYFSMM